MNVTEDNAYDTAIGMTVFIAGEGLPGGPEALMEALQVAKPLLEAGWHIWRLIDSLRGMAQMGTTGEAAGNALLEVNRGRA